MTVMVLSAPDDDTATRVCQALNDRGRDYARMDLGDFPETLSFTATGPDPAWVGSLSDGQRDLRLSDITAVYYRRPSSFRLPSHLPAQHRRFAMLCDIAAPRPPGHFQPAQIAEAQRLAREWKPTK